MSTYGPAGQPLVASDGALYWPRIWGGGLLKSTDKGKTWMQISTATKDNPIELPGKVLAGVADKQVMTSADGGVTWTKVGPPIPFTPNGLIFSDKGHSFFAWALSDHRNKKLDSIVRLTVP